MYAIRQWSVRHARGLNAFYNGFESTLVALNPLWKFIGYQRLERPVAAVERTVKGLLFDCRMCGQCILSSTGMSCPMNCPKNLRNGPCGGVSVRIAGGREALQHVQVAVDRRLQGKSSWLRVVRQRVGELT